MTEKLFASIEQAMKALHFEQARQLLQNNEELLVTNNPWKYWMLSGKTAQAMIDNEKAMDCYEKARNCASSLKEQVLTMARQVRLLCLLTRLEEARSLYDQITEMWKGKLLADIPMAGALLAMEEGNNDKALEECRDLLLCSDIDAPMKTEACALMGDLYSFKEQMETSVEWYEKALEAADGIEQNWRDLRKGLIYNNMADSYEQKELWPQAMDCYKKALHLMDLTTDQEIYDLAGYNLEVLLSDLSCLIYQDEYEAAGPLFDKARPLLKKVPYPSDLYWKGRIQFLRGLFWLYQSDNDQAFPLLNKAWQTMSRFCHLSGITRNEYLGKAAYYAAYTMPEGAEYDAARRQLYQCALENFRYYQSRDPNFYDHSLASICNEMGIMDLHDHPQKARLLFEYAAKGFEKCMHKEPEDSFSGYALLGAIYNLLSLKDLSEEDQKPWIEKYVSVIDVLKEHGSKEEADFYAGKLLDLYEGREMEPDLREALEQGLESRIAA